MTENNKLVKKSSKTKSKYIKSTCSNFAPYYSEQCSPVQSYSRATGSISSIYKVETISINLSFPLLRSVFVSSPVLSSAALLNPTPWSISPLFFLAHTIYLSFFLAFSSPLSVCHPSLSLSMSLSLSDGDILVKYGTYFDLSISVCLGKP